MRLIDRDDSILFVIDLQTFFLDKIGEPRSSEIVDNCRFIAEMAVRLDIPVFVTVEQPQQNGQTVAAVRSCLSDAVGDRDKRVFGLCGQADLRQAVLEQGRRTAILVGLETDVCVLHSAAGLLEEGFRSVIVSDATGAPGIEHELGLRRARSMGVELIHTKGLHYEWVRSLDGFAALRKDGPLAAPMSSKL